MGQKAAAAAGRELRREDWRLVIRAHLADSREEAIAAVRDGREHEREHYYRRVAGMKNDTTLEEEIEQDTSIIGTPDDMIAALHRLQDATGGFGGFMVLANDWAPHEATLRSYELIARRVMPELRGHLAPLRASYDMVASNKRSLRRAGVAAIRQAYDGRRRGGARRPRRLASCADDEITEVAHGLPHLRRRLRHHRRARRRSRRAHQGRSRRSVVAGLHVLEGPRRARVPPRSRAGSTCR